MSIPFGDLNNYEPPIVERGQGRDTPSDLHWAACNWGRMAITVLFVVGLVSFIVVTW